MSKRWVCHISGQGEKWEVTGRLYNQEQNEDWQVASKTSKDEISYHYLPKSEYRLCPAPEVWKDVTERCEMTPTGLLRIVNDDKTHTYLSESNGYRFIKCGLWKQGDARGTYESQPAFIVEKKVQP